ncbi:MAG TPA: response regulator [Cyclobacteriaceae bacterium]|nr:response regulator [Cyclobacteriaceae bacterium]
MKEILLVEDTAHLAEEIASVLQLEGYKVTVANSGMQALSFLVDHKPDLIISDILMPGMDGFELITKIRQNKLFTLTPVIILSARASAEDKKRGEMVGANRFITKPCKISELISAIQSMGI